MLWQDFLLQQDPPCYKPKHHFSIYERHFARFRGQSIVFYEIGVCDGGSLGMWRRYFGSSAVVVGIDINPECIKHQTPAATSVYPGGEAFVRIGSQVDCEFLNSLIEEFGPPDIVLDDGSHQSEHMIKSFEYIYPLMPRNGVYMVEDTACCYWPEYGGGIDNPNSFINYSKDLIDQLNAEDSRGSVQMSPFGLSTLGASFYRNIVCFEKGNPRYSV